jgi:hypothetical protein
MFNYSYTILPNGIGGAQLGGFGANPSTATIDLLPKKASHGSPSDKSPLVLIQVKTQIARRVLCDKVEMHLQISGIVSSSADSSVLNDWRSEP